MDEKHLNAVDIAKQYYDSHDADHFYASIWGGEDIHIGIYESDDESISSASRRTIRRIASRLDWTPKHRVLDIGAGFGGASRFLAETYGCRVVSLNISEVENERNRKLNRERGLDEQIEVVEGSFEDIPYPADTFDRVWSQDAILHSGNRLRVFQEVHRVLRGDGDFVFTDPMQTDECPDGVLQPILDRIHLKSLGSPASYRAFARRVGMEEVGFEEWTSQLITHYTRVLQETETQERRLRECIDPDYIARMKKGLQYWIDGGKKGYLTWGIFHFRKRGG